MSSFSFSTRETAATTGAVVGSKRVGLCKSTGIWMKKAAAKANSQPELEPGGILWPNFRAIQLVLAGRRSRTSFFFVKALGSSSRKASDFDHDDENKEWGIDERTNELLGAYSRTPFSVRPTLSASAVRTFKELRIFNKIACLAIQLLPAWLGALPTPPFPLRSLSFSPTLVVSRSPVALSLLGSICLLSVCLWTDTTMSKH